ncbi:hypothetical protein BRC67_01535 [Halobacteriales archaeon QH_3_68_24]|nr:MAG: hypothetical protein BRC67_01535 [Halobacteriales archaeon QH_3_68_24]
MHVDVYVRSLPTHGSAANAVLGRLSALEKRGFVDAHDVLVWGSRAPPSPASARTTTGREIARQAGLFREWARRNDVAASNDVALAPAMESRVVESTIREAEYEEVRLPELLVATYCGEDLVAVCPHVQDGEVCTPRLYLDRFPDATDGNQFVPVERAWSTGKERAVLEASAGSPGAVASERNDSGKESEQTADDDAIGRPPSL